MLGTRDLQPQDLQGLTLEALAELAAQTPERFEQAMSGPLGDPYEHRSLEGEPALVIAVRGHEDRFPADWNSSAAEAVRGAAGRHIDANRRALSNAQVPLYQPIRAGTDA